MKKRDTINIICALLGAVVAAAVVMYALLGFNVNRMRVKAYASRSGADESAAAAQDAGEAGAETEAVRTTEAVSTEEPLTLAADRESRSVASVTADVIENISSSYDGTVTRFLTGVTDLQPDEYNRPAKTNALAETLSGLDARTAVYCSDEVTPHAAFIFVCTETENDHTEEVLDLLDRNNIRATFFVTHSYAMHSADLINRMIEEGHEIGSYSYIRPDGGIASYPLEDQMTDAMNMQNYMFNAYDYTMQKYSLNECYWSEQSVKLLSEMGYEVCFPSISFVPGITVATVPITDAAGNLVEAETTAEEVVLDADTLLSGLERGLHNGCIYSFYTGDPTGMSVLESLIGFCGEQGFTIVQLD